MKTFLKSLKRQEGFTLVELMVVVAIIGLLSAVAIPNFKKYQAKAKTSEAKLQLSAVYTAEQSFFADYGIYHTCLNYMGYDPSNERLQRYYAVGFPLAATTIEGSATSGSYGSAVNSGLNSTACPITTAPVDSTAGAPPATTTWYQAGKTIGSNVVTTVIGFGLTAAAAATIANTRVTTAVSDGLGVQDVVDRQTFRAAASGYVDANYILNNGSVFTINQEKQILNPRIGF